MPHMAMHAWNSRFGDSGREGGHGNGRVVSYQGQTLVGVHRLHAEDGNGVSVVASIGNASRCRNVCERDSDSGGSAHSDGHHIDRAVHNYSMVAVHVRVNRGRDDGSVSWDHGRKVDASTADDCQSAK